METMTPSEDFFLPTPGMFIGGSCPLRATFAVNAKVLFSDMAGRKFKVDRIRKKYSQSELAPEKTSDRWLSPVLSPVLQCDAVPCAVR